jgi:hypothetical protein
MLGVVQEFCLIVNLNSLPASSFRATYSKLLGKMLDLGRGTITVRHRNRKGITQDARPGNAISQTIAPTWRFGWEAKDAPIIVRIVVINDS